jgi:hypothetical protein
MLMLVLQNEQLCLNEGFCLPDCDREPFYRCSCPAGWEGPTCNLKVFFLFVDWPGALLRPSSYLLLQLKGTDKDRFFFRLPLEFCFRYFFAFL